MRTVEISQAADSLPEYGRRKRGETWVLTRRGRPVAAVVPIDGYKATGGISLAEMPQVRRPREAAAPPRSSQAAVARGRPPSFASSN